MKKLLAAVLAINTIFIFTDSFAAPYKEINAKELQKMQSDDPALVIIDSRSGDWFDGVLIKGATQLATSDTNKQTLAKLAPKKDQPVVFYCVNEQCPASAKAAHKAAKVGYTNLFEYPGGIEDWKKRDLPTVTIAKKDE